MTNSVFEESWWLDIVAPGKWSDAVVKDGDRVIARLPYVFDKGVITNPTYTQTLGIWMDPSLREKDKGGSNIHKQKELIGELIAQLPKSKRISIILDHSQSYILPFRWLDFRIEPTFSYRIRGVNEIDVRTELYGKTVKKNIKAASRHVSIDTDCDDLEILVNMQDKTYKRQGRSNPVDRNVTLDIMKKTVEQGHGKLLVARGEDGRAHSAGFFIFDERICYYLLGGFDPEFNSDGSQNLLLDAGIEFAQGVSRDFDFEGSMVEGIENFYRQYGGDLVTNYHVSKQRLIYDIEDIMKPRIKRMIGYKV